MIKEIPVFNIAGEKISSEIIDVSVEKPNIDVLHRYITAFCANQRQGNACTKTRGEVSGSGRKPWRQKGTGRARVGSIRNPLWRHGGVVFGPKPRDYRQNIPEKMKKIALRDSLMTRINEDALSLIKLLDEVKSPKTKMFADFLKKIGCSETKVLFILNRDFDKRNELVMSIRNIENVSYCYVEQINPYLILLNDRIIAQSDVFSVLKTIVAGDENV
ncbi:MAG: 50S ribosomal protein L4 [Candidatus Omnitrophica bacterium]|jgi:large subunit ribosomal protein L4|nr:50S ribosomal protein L4 [Candidatus Omnitrophota bacterium]